MLLPYLLNLGMFGGSTTTLSPPSGAIVVSGNTPSVTLVIAAIAGSIVVGGNAPSVTTSLAPTTGSVVVGGNAPSIASIFAPSPGAIILGGNAPSLAKTLAPTEGAVVIDGNAPTVAVGTILSPAEGSVVFAGQTPSLTWQVAPTTGNIVVSGNAPTVDLIVETHRSRRSWLRRIADGYGTLDGVESRGEVGTAAAHGHVAKPKKRVGVAVTGGRSLFSEVGVVKGKGVGKAKPGELRAARGALGEVIPHSGAHAEAEGYESQGECGKVRAHGGAAAFTAAHAFTGIAGEVRGRGITNPTAAEMLSLVVALRRRRRR